MTIPENVVFMDKPKRFTLSEARSLMPQIREMTEDAVRMSAPIIQALEQPADETERERLSHELNAEIEKWSNEVRHLGAIAKGLWLVDFDTGAGYYCWQFNEEELSFYHGYEEGFGGRTPIQ